jgi:hypothetical protein
LFGRSAAAHRPRRFLCHPTGRSRSALDDLDRDALAASATPVAARFPCARQRPAFRQDLAGLLPADRLAMPTALATT